MERKKESIVDYNTFLNKYSIIAIKFSYPPSIIKQFLINIKIFSLPQNTTINCLVIMDDKAIYNSLNKRAIH